MSRTATILKQAESLRDFHEEGLKQATRLIESIKGGVSTPPANRTQGKVRKIRVCKAVSRRNKHLKASGF